MERVGRVYFHKRTSFYVDPQNQADEICYIQSLCVDTHTPLYQEKRELCLHQCGRGTNSFPFAILSSWMSTSASIIKDRLIGEKQETTVIKQNMYTS